jgi:triacylglycerol lipase
MIVPRLRAPIVLVHGLLGFERLRLGPLTLFEYFRGVPELLRSGGNRVLVPSLSPTAGIAHRAEQLRRFLDRESPHEPVHLFGHSLGGLDSRYFISRLGQAARVLTLTSIGTPHRGTTFADWGVKRFASLLRPVFDFVGMPVQAFFDLTIPSCTRFNAETPDAKGVRYFSVAGRCRIPWTNPTWRLPAGLVEKAEGPCDGIVSIRSATWGEGCEEWEADHVELVNWPRPFRGRLWNAATLDNYVRLVRRLVDEGF